MRFCFITLFALMMTACLQAVTVRWDLGKCPTAVDWYSDAAGAVYLVQSATELSDVHAIAKTAADGGVVKGDNSTAPVSFLIVDDNATNKLQATFDGTQNSFYYVVVFKQGTTEGTLDYSSYAVYAAQQYVADGQGGYYNTTVEGPDGEEPNLGDFVEIAYKGGNGVPEPTVFALIAFGVAGLALRRKLS